MASDREKERQERHSIFYHESTSEIKNDIGALLDCWKGPGLSNKSSFPLGRTEAGFLLWYHALNNQDSLQEMFDNGAIGTSILVLDQQSSELGAVTDTERTVASSLLRLLVDNEDFRDKFLSAKGQAGSGFEVLSESLSNILVGQERVAGILRVLAEGAKHRGRIITNFSPLPWKEYVNVLADRRNKNQAAKTELAFFIRYVTMGSDELKEEAGEAGIISGLLEMLRTCKSESALNAAAGCLYRLTEADLVLDRLAEEGGIKLLADLISAPPKLYIKAASLEKKRRHTPATAAVFSYRYPG